MKNQRELIEGLNIIDSSKFCYYYLCYLILSDFIFLENQTIECLNP